mgnify:CR=1 FL=1
MPKWRRYCNSTLMTAAAVSISGVVGWVGLLVPHVARLLTGPGNARLLPASACLGGIFLLLADRRMSKLLK